MLAVTVLTSLDQSQIEGIGYEREIRELVLRLARLAQSAGCDGLVCSPLEVAEIRKETSEELLLVTPGIRPTAADHQDQSRVRTPAEAIRAGATHLVIGRPITKAKDPRAAAASILSEITAAKIG